MSRGSGDNGSCLGKILKVLLILAIPVLIVACILIFKPNLDLKKPIKNLSTEMEALVPENKQPEKVVEDDQGENEEPIKFQKEENEYNILILGYDKTEKITDVVLVVNINDNDEKLHIMQIPGDTYFRVDGAEQGNKVKEIFLNCYNSRVNKGESGDTARENALKDTKDYISNGLFIHIDQVALMDVDGFGGIVDSIDGVEMNLTSAFTYYDEDVEDSVTLPKGNVVIDGKTAKYLVMIGDNEEVDLNQIKVQKEFVVAFITKLQKTIGINNILKLKSLIEKVAKCTVTDMKVSEMLKFATTMMKYDGTSTTVLTMPCKIYGSGLVMNKAGALTVINKYFNTFDKEIPLNYFDPDSYFCDKTDDGFVKIYNASADELSDKNGFTVYSK